MTRSGSVVLIGSGELTDKGVTLMTAECIDCHDLAVFTGKTLLVEAARWAQDHMGAHDTAVKGY